MIQVLLGIARHPLNQGQRLRALARFARWQIGTRLVGAPVAVPFAGSTRLLVNRGMTGATGNVYCGLHEFEEMAFVLHALRGGDVFVDVGANVGSYTVLAAGVAGARCVSIEPVPQAFARLQDNVRLNDMAELVSCHNVAIGATSGTARFTCDLDTINHVSTQTDTNARTIDVPILTLDALMGGLAPTLVKIDVEGYETAVIAGGDATFRSPSLLAVLMELNGSGQRYGFDEDALRDRMTSLGFAAARYDPALRLLQPPPARQARACNALYVRRRDELQARLAEASPVRVRDLLV